MTYELVATGDRAGADQGPSEYRRTHYRVYDENGFVGGFATNAPENFTLERVNTYLCDRFSGTGGTGFDSKDLIVLLGSRIVAVVRRGREGKPEVTCFPQEAEAAVSKKENTR